MIINLAKDDDAYLWITLHPELGQWYNSEGLTEFDLDFFQHFLVETTNDNSSVIQYADKRFYLFFVSTTSPRARFSYNRHNSSSFVHAYPDSNEFEMVVGYEYAICSVVDKEVFDDID